MDVKLLEAFRAVVDTRSVTAAAQAMGITQPAVSSQIAKLEESVGFSLFERLVVETTDRSRGNPHELGFPSWPVAETLMLRVRPLFERPLFRCVARSSVT